MNVSFLGYKIHIEFSFILIITLLFFTGKSFFVLSALLASFIHELGHITALELAGFPTRQLNLSAFKLDIIDLDKIDRTLREDLIILLAGPICNLFVFILSYSIYMSAFRNYYLYFFAIENLFLFIFNLLPIANLDGGQIVFLLLQLKMGVLSAQRFLLISSAVFIYLISCLGFYIFLKSGYNISVLLFSINIYTQIYNINTHTQKH
ncbi:MAG: site-2 protease family protein [Clostridia bacterium]|nr:site-2 protease family protein [Clostridia bacterium]